MYKPFTEEKELNGYKVLEYFTHGINGTLYHGMAWEGRPYIPYLLLPLITILDEEPLSEQLQHALQILEVHCQ